MAQRASGRFGSGSARWTIAEMRELAAQAQVRATAGAVADLLAPVRERLLLLERVEANGEAVERQIRVGTLGAETQGRPAPGA